MADNKEENKKGGIVKIAIFAAAGLVLLGIGLGIGALIFGGGSEPDPSAEVSEILEGKNPEKEKEEEKSEDNSAEEESEVEMECVENADGEEECVPKKKVKKVNVEEKFLTTYYEFPGNFTTNLRDSKRFLQITVGVSTQYDEEVMVNVESHQLALRGIILGVMSEYSEQDVAGRDGKQGLADGIKDALNIFLEDKEGFGGVEGIHFTSFVLQ
ncbi:MAG: flagellar basal body-associated FliL family protein [Alphaproteobacteria bacterium TMED93]|nr:MAG: flagellar basal body-associated FliL family protein [Alphaproteobacteria bacterium TMED93]